MDFKLPELGENITQGDVVNVLVEEGQAVAVNQGVLELETDKAVVEIPCPHAGKVTKIHVKKGDTIKVGQTVLSLEADAEAVSPDEGEPVPEVVARNAAPPTQSLAGPKESARKPIVEKPSSPRSAAPAKPAAITKEERAAPLPAGPAARRVAREMGVDLRQVQGTGTRGRITPEDVQSAAAGPGAPGEAGVEPSRGPVVPPGEPGQDGWGEVRREKMSQIRKKIAEHMTRSATTIPHVTNFDDADITELENFRKGIPEGFFGAGLKLTTMPLILKAVAAALRRHPMLNASLDEENGQIIYKQYVHLGIAVDTPRGLVVPVIRNVDHMGLPEIVRTLASVARRARDVQFSLEDLRGGTFTISNLGAVGGTYSTPIINHPEVAILLVGRSRWLAAVRGDKIEPRLMLPLSLSYDHRLVDGATAARFLNDVIESLQSPARLLLG